MAVKWDTKDLADARAQIEALEKRIAALEPKAPAKTGKK